MTCAPLTVGSLFSGIGGFELGLERAGMRVIWQAETDPFASAVLRKHWPGVPNYGDVRTISAGRVERPDVVCGGFPCQDISNAGKRAGIDGERSGLWGEFARVIGELRPRYVIVENVAALLGRGIERVLGDLAALGFDAEWHCIPASAVGAPHRRDRVWIVADADEQRCAGGWLSASEGAALLHAAGRDGSNEASTGAHGSGACADVADADQPRLEGHDDGSRAPAAPGTITANIGAGIVGNGADWWIAEPDVGRVADGVPSRVDRLRCLGNAIVPQIAEVIGRAIVERETMRGAA